MQFLNPSALWLLLLGLIPVVLYLFRRRSKKVSVSTLVFFKTLAKEHQESAWLRRLKKILSFLLTILILALAVFILARLIAPQDDADQYRSIVILLDRSASMGVEDETGVTRLDEAKAVLLERLKKVPEEIGVALIAYDVRPEVLQPRTLKRRELISRLEGVQTRPMVDRAEAGLESARLIAGLDPPTAIWHVSDHSLPMTDEQKTALLDSGMQVRELNLALPTVTNPGFTAFQIRPVPLEYARYDAYVQVALNTDAPKPVTARVNVSVGGIPSQFREIDLNPGERNGYTFRINGSRDQLLRIALECESDDFELDNLVTLPLPDPQPILAAWIRPDETEDPYTRFALSSIQESGRFELLKGGADAWPLSEQVDAVIFDGWLPTEWPDDIPVVVINPPGPSGPVYARRLSSPIPYESVRVGNEDHPLLFRVSSNRLSVTQTSLFQTQGSLEPLWFAGKDPVLAAGEVKGQRLVVMGFSPGISERLPLTASFPLLVGNSLLWAVNRSDEDLSGARGVGLYSTGDLAPMAGEQITWSDFSKREARKVRLPLQTDVVEMDRIGVWESDSGERGASHLLSAVESDIPAFVEGSVEDKDYFESHSGVAGNLKWWLLGVVVILLLLESFLFHRLAVY